METKNVLKAEVHLEITEPLIPARLCRTLCYQRLISDRRAQIRPHCCHCLVHLAFVYIICHLRKSRAFAQPLR